MSAPVLRARWLAGLAVTTTLSAILTGGSAALAASAAKEPALRICASTKEAPYSSGDGTGFENRIAASLAKAMGRKAEFVFTDKYAIYLVRDSLNAGACDVVVGVDVDDERMLTTDAIYRTGYVFVSREDRQFAGTKWEDAGRPDLGRFAIRFHGPGETILKYTGKWEDNAAYLYSLINFQSRRNSYNNVEAARLVSEVTSGEADLAIAFAPDVARYVKASGVPVRMQLIDNDIPRPDGKIVPLHYAQAIGVRKDDASLLAEINAALPKVRADIRRILEEEGIPLLPLGS
ncbi:methanol oxidation system protein MoxJ [Oleisolibacter albus]|uniref:methanol oxidation system protein MoxJ n=1 Tax=Oleisolibacter albus TaxID=2171757 RepID=UPI000DF48D44|nr:methanol oxidation system protein MoxJ [Oleisolibacter albus]